MGGGGGGGGAWVGFGAGWGSWPAGQRSLEGRNPETALRLPFLAPSSFALALVALFLVAPPDGSPPPPPRSWALAGLPEVYTACDSLEFKTRAEAKQDEAFALLKRGDYGGAAGLLGETRDLFDKVCFSFVCIF